MSEETCLCRYFSGCQLCFWGTESSSRHSSRFYRRHRDPELFVRCECLVKQIFPCGVFVSFQNYSNQHSKTRRRLLLSSVRSFVEVTYFLTSVRYHSNQRNILYFLTERFPVKRDFGDLMVVAAWSLEHNSRHNRRCRNRRGFHCACYNVFAREFF